MRKKIYFLVVCFSFAVCTAFAANTSVSSRSIQKHTQDTSTTDYNIRTNQKKVARSTLQRSNKTTPQTNLADRKSSKTLKSRSGINKTITPSYSTVNNISSRSNPDNSSIKKRSQTRTPSLNHVYNNRDQNSSINTKKQLSFVSRAAEIDKKVVADVKSKNLSLCKTTYYDCMDEFCANKDSSLRRCACSKRIHEFDNIKKQLANFEDKMLNFNQRLLTVSMSKEDAAAINVATEGEEAYQTKDSSESQKLLDKITSALNSSGDTKLNTNLSAISLSLDKNAAWDNIDSTAGISTTSKEGIDLYNAALPVCQDMAKEVCSNEEFDIIKDNYLLSIEQDCNTVAKSYDSQYNAAKDKIYESSALLDMSRLNAYQQKNSDDALTCKSKMLEGLYSTSVCGNDLYKCLDITGRYIDPSTGEAVLSENLFQFTNLLQEPSTNQTWASVPNNSNFINFLNTKKDYLTDTFANCQDSADIIWKDFLNDALAKIKIAQNAKIEEVKQSCTTLLSECTSSTLEKLEDFDARALSVFSLKAQITAHQMCSDIKESCISLMNTQSDWTEGTKGISDDIIFSKIIENCTLVGKNCIIEQCDGIAGNFSLCTNMNSQKYKDIILRNACWTDIQNCVNTAIEDTNVTYSSSNGIYDSNIDNIGLGATFFKNVYDIDVSSKPQDVASLCSECGNDKECKTCMVTERIFGNCSAKPDTPSSQILESKQSETLLYWFAKNVNTSTKDNNCSTKAQEYTLTYYFSGYGYKCTQTFSNEQWPFLCTGDNIKCTPTDNSTKTETTSCPSAPLGYSFVFTINGTEYYQNNKYYSPGDVSITTISTAANKYTVQYNGNGNTSGSTSSSSHTYDNGPALTANGFEKTGYNFNGWNTQADGTGTSYPDKATKNLTSTQGAIVTLYAQWKPITYTITYELNGGTNYTNAPKNYNIETPTITLGTPTKKGYIFTGWFTNELLTITASTTIHSGSTGDIKLYAGWEPITYTIHFDGNGSPDDAMSDLTPCEYDTDYKLTKNPYERTGYTFAGWKNTADNKTYVDEASVNNLADQDGATVTLYAQWTPITYNIEYVLNGGTNYTNAPANYTIETATITLGTPTKKGYTFTGWYDGTKVTQITTGSIGNKTLSAQWTPITYTITYNGNKNTGGSTSSSSHVYDEPKALTTNGFIKTGYNFAGWNTAANGSGDSYTNNQSVTKLTSTNNATVTLYAQWTPITYTITYNGNKNTGGSTSSSSHVYDEPKALTTNGFIKTGYNFAGWNTAANGSGDSYTNNQSVVKLTSTQGATVTLYAQWEPQS